ncbi:hypothetical protein AcW1_008710 [Taiwanofungus camphoratus]|nr:hypothetical protein AcV5_006731 [Antrodia cinnamomea]KAI0935342.1 hypothetical protein AcV7_003807 [Antrodia cinnamomea]KAI0948987.1 hypothetical protein AcW1_008710 [Antrodia cinnamomea]
MPHADSALIPPALDRTEFWTYVHDQLAGLLEDQRNWVTNLANTSSLIYSSLLAYHPHFGQGDRAVNWCGFYLESTLFPVPRISQIRRETTRDESPKSSKLLLGPFCGKPACQFINVTPGRARGVCADAYFQRKTLLVPDVVAYPGHIACDGDTKSEIVCPLILRGRGEEKVVGVLDLDCLALDGFTEEDRRGLEKIADLVVNACDW